MYLKRTIPATGDIPVWQRGKDFENAQGGFRLLITGLVLGSVLKAGTPMIFDEAAGTAKPVLTAVMAENAAADAVTYRVKKGSNLIVGSNFAAVAGGKAYAITAIDKTNTNYDTVTVGTTIGAVTADSLVYGSSTTGATNSSFGGVRGLLYADTVVEPNATVSVTIKGTIYARRVPYSADLEKALPRIVYSQSY